MYVGKNPHRRRHQMRDILVRCPSVPKARGTGAPALCDGIYQCDCLSDTRSPTPLLVLSFGQVEVVMEKVGDTPPLMLDLAETGRNLY